MKKFKILLGITMAAALGLAANVQAVQITGSIDMSGTATLNNVNLGLATAATSFSGVTVGGTPTGAFAGVPSPGVTPVAWNPLTWSPSTPASPLWTFVVGAWTYKFDLANVAIVTQNNTFLNLLGNGTLYITGAGSPYDPTAGIWSFTISNPSGSPHANFQFTFANSQTAVAPDGGTTAMLLGGALAGLAFLRRKLA